MRIQQGPEDFIYRIFDVLVTIDSRSKPAAIEAVRSYVSECCELGERAKLVIMSRYGIDGESCTFQAIGTMLHVTLERARQIHNGAIKVLRRCRTDESALLYFCVERSPALSVRTIQGLYAALSKAEDLLAKQVNVVQQITRTDRSESTAFPIKLLKLSTRTMNALRASGIHNTNDLQVRSRFELLRLEGMGRVGVDQIVTALESRGLRLRE